MKKLLFICLGNICRSPAGEAVMQSLVEEAGLSDQIYCDSAGTWAWHSGERADARMRSHATKRGVDIKSIARQFQVDDFEEFDYLICMDKSNYTNVTALDPNGKFRHKVFMMTEFDKARNEQEVPDPYFGGEEGFELVLDMVEAHCRKLLNRVKLEL